MKKREIISYVLWFICITLIVSKDWLVYKFGNVEFSQYLFHLLGPKEGSNTDVFRQYFVDCGPKIIGIFIILILIYFLLQYFLKNIESTLVLRIYQRVFRIPLLGYSWCKKIILPISLVAVFCTSYVFMNELEVNEYLKLQYDSSMIYETFYVDPKGKVTFPEEKRNLVLIYLESMENTFSSLDNNGAVNENYIKELTFLAKNNINFSHNSNSLGGAFPSTGTGWTTAALLATTSGVNLKLPVDYNYMQTDKYLGGIYTLGDLLHENGYNQTCMIGSDAAFGNRATYYQTHGDYNIIDYKKAIENG